jgi:hypothetical protein
MKRAVLQITARVPSVGIYSFVESATKQGKFCVECGLALFPDESGLSLVHQESIHIQKAKILPNHSVRHVSFVV